MMLFLLGAILITVVVADGTAAIYFAMTERLGLASLLAMNFALMGGAIQLGFFG